MSNRTYTHLSDEEFLSVIDYKGQHSPTILECIRRIEHLTKAFRWQQGVNSNVACPVCEAPLHVEIDANQNLDLNIRGE